MADDFTEFFNIVASRLSVDGFSIQRDVRTNLYALNILATRRDESNRGARIPLSKVVSVISVDSPSTGGVSAYSSFVEKYALENKTSLSIHNRDLTTLPVVVSSGVTDGLKEWISETAPSYNMMWDRTVFPVLVDMSSRSVIYYKQTPFQHMHTYPDLRNLSDKWFEFQEVTK